jgi:hypothetical protein
MRSGYVGFALAWILMTILTSQRLMANAPGIFFVFLVPPGLILLYGLAAQEPPLPEPVLMAPALPGQPDFSLPPVPAAGAPDLHSVPAMAPAGPNAAPPGTGFDEAVDYAKAAFFRSGRQVILLTLATILFAIPLCGYLVRVLHGDEHAPEAGGWAGLFYDGIRAAIILMIYLLPAAMVYSITASIMNSHAVTSPGYLGASQSVAIYGVLLGIVLLLAAAFFAPAGLIRFARTGSMNAAFSFGPVVTMIRRIGWLPYSGFLMICFILAFIASVLTTIPYIGLLIILVLTAPIAIVEARYLVILYDHGSGA